MNYLLDTHVVIWAILDEGKLSGIVKNELENSENRIFVSSVALWEITLKFSVGKLELNGLLPENLPDVLIETGFELISLSPYDCSSVNHLIDFHHKDPFDRMLIWQAIKNNFTLITKDDRIKQYSSAGLKVLW